MKLTTLDSKHLNRLWLLSLVFVISACGSNPLKTDYNPDYQIDPDALIFITGTQDKDSLSSGLTATRIKHAIATRLESQYRVTNRKKLADVVINIKAIKNQKNTASTVNVHYGFSHHGMFFYDPLNTGTNKKNRPILLIEAQDVKSGDTFWQGRYNGKFNKGVSPVERIAHINMIIEQMFSLFPN